jgi:alkylated DNA repair protein alkB family protein 6
MTVNLLNLLKQAKEEKLGKIESKAESTNSLILDFHATSPLSPMSPCAFPADLDGVSVSNSFLSPQDSSNLYSHLTSLSLKFSQLRGRRCLALGGRVTPTGLIPGEGIPDWLHRLIDRVYTVACEPMGLPRPNHALINAYEPGEGIMPHEDGPAYTPYATILSLGSAAVFDFLSRDREPLGEIFLPVGSLMMFHSNAYDKHLHSFDSRATDLLTDRVINQGDRGGLGESVISGDELFRGRRISITMRHVKSIDS